MLVGCDPGRDGGPFPHVATKAGRNRDVLVDGARGGLPDTHHLQNGGRVAPPHQVAGQGDDRTIVSHAFQSRVAARPSYAVEHDVALSDRRDELVWAETGQDYAVVRRVQPHVGKSVPETSAKRRGDLAAACEFDEGELAIAHLARDASEHTVVLRQVFGRRLAAPVDDG